MRPRILLILLPTLFLCAPIRAASDLQFCVPVEPAERSACLDTWLGDQFADPLRLSRLGDLPEEHPEIVLELVERAKLPPDLSGNPARAVLQDLRGRALLTLGKGDEATKAFARAMTFDDGLPRLTWLNDVGERAWAAALDSGAGRQFRLARGIAAQGRHDVARAVLMEVLPLDPGREAIELWKSIGGRQQDTLQPTPLTAPIWSPALPPVEINLYDGGVFRPSEAAGDVLILTFWATWCQPCQEELPMLQALYDGQRDNGLTIIAINGQEPKGVALPFARSLGLTMPLAHYQAKFHEMLNVSTLPTTILVDRWGRMQGRWSGYERGQEDVIERDARHLLGMREKPVENIAEFLLGDGMLEAVWSREISAPIDGLAVEQSEGGPKLLLSTARTVLVIDAFGETEDRRAGDAMLGLMRRADLNGDGEGEIVGFRRGSSSVVRLSEAEWKPERHAAPHPVLDVELLPAKDPEAKGTILLGTTAGLFAEADGAEPVRVAGVDLVHDVAVLDRPEAFRVVALDDVPSWRRIDLDTTEVAEPTPAPKGTRRIIPGKFGFGLAPAAVIAATEVGLPAGAPAIAVAMVSGQLVLLDAATGKVQFRARWEGINDLLAADLDADGVEELVVAAGRRLTVLRWSDNRPKSGTTPLN